MNSSIVYNVVVVFVLYLLNGKDLNLSGPVLVRASWNWCNRSSSSTDSKDDPPYGSSTNLTSGGGGTPAGGGTTTNPNQTGGVTQGTGGGGNQSGTGTGLEVFVDGSIKANDPDKVEKKNDSGSTVEYTFKNDGKCTHVKCDGNDVWKKGNHNLDEPKSISYNSQDSQIIISNDKRGAIYSKKSDGTWSFTSTYSR